METIQDNDDKKLTKSEIEYRLFETLRWKTLEIGDSVAAKVDSQESWILGRVVKKWDSPGLSYTEMKDLSDVCLAITSNVHCSIVGVITHFLIITNHRSRETRCSTKMYTFKVTLPLIILPRIGSTLTVVLRKFLMQTRPQRIQW